MRIIQRLENSIIIKNNHSIFFISPKDVTHKLQVLPWGEELEQWMILVQSRKRQTDRQQLETKGRRVQARNKVQFLIVR